MPVQIQHEVEPSSEGVPTVHGKVPGLTIGKMDILKLLHHDGNDSESFPKLLSETMRTLDNF